MLLSPWPASPVNNDDPLCTSAMRLPSFVPDFILDSMFARKSIWPSLDRVISEYSAWPACSMVACFGIGVHSAKGL
jgi:hypothetical protein